MSSFLLAKPREADDLIARLFQVHQSCILRAREDNAFKPDAWFDFGWIDLFPIPDDRPQQEGMPEPDEAEDTRRLAERYTLAVRRGQYEWRPPEPEAARAALEAILVNLPEGKKPADDARRESKLRRTLDLMATIAARIGLFHPRFDSHALAQMPYRRPLSIVADTSGISQGGLDFVARFLCPVARTKVPAIAHMEVINFSHRFLSNSRSGDVRALDLLMDHLQSQGSQRAILRLEFHSDIEIERSFLLGDPLRSAFAKDTDKDLSSLNLSTDVPSYADRMIVEAARHHQMQGGPGHQVQLLTSDHGLAKMAMSEGIVPLYFRSVDNGQLFGRKMTGANFHPFGGSLQCTPLSALLWECATAFGRAKLETPDGKERLEVAAFGKDFSWSPYHSKDDLLWMDGSSISPWKPPAPVTDPVIPPVDPPVDDPASQTATPAPAPHPASRSTPAPVPFSGWYTFKVQALFDLIVMLDDQQTLTEEAVRNVVGSKAKSAAKEYQRFLRSGGLIPPDSWSATPKLQKLAIALRQNDLAMAGGIFATIPSVARFFDGLAHTDIGQPWDSSVINRGVGGYMALGEILLSGASVTKSAYYPTPARPTPREFPPLALEAFRTLDTGGGLISTGAWLERMIVQFGVHPELSRELLMEASAAGLLQRSTEGSTTDTRHDEHRISVLRVKDGHPIVESVHLYRGDYLIPGKSSSSIRIGVP
jgi:hypothetical protein